jgi:hypothetical protein
MSQVSYCPANAGGIGNGRPVDVFDYEKVNITVWCWVPVGVRSEKDDLFGVELIDKDSQKRAQLIRDLVERILRVLEDIFPNLGRYRWQNFHSGQGSWQ